MKCYMFNDDVISLFTKHVKEYLSVERMNFAFIMRYNFAVKLTGKNSPDSYRLYAILRYYAHDYRWYGPKDVKTVPFFGFSIPVENFKSV